MGEILVADDDPEVVALLGAVLVRAGHDHVAVADAAEAVARLGERRFDLILTGLPAAGGVIAAAARLQPAAAIIALLGGGARGDAGAALAAGAYDIATKPLGRAEVLRRVENALAYVTLRREHERLIARAAERCGPTDGGAGDSPAVNEPPPGLSERAVVPEPAAGRPAQAGGAAAGGLPTLRSFLEVQERRYIGHVLAAVRGDKARAAAVLDVSLATFYRKVDPSQKAPRRRRAAG